MLGLAAGTDVWVDDHSGDGDDGWNEAGDDNGSGAHTGAYNAPSFDVVEGYCRHRHMLFYTPANNCAYLVMGGVSLEGDGHGMLFHLVPDGSGSSVIPLLGVTVHFGGCRSYFQYVKADEPRHTVAFPSSVTCQ